MSGELPPTVPRFPLQTIRAMDELAREFRRVLRDHAVRLSSPSGDASLVTPELVARALPLACGELLHEEEMADERGLDGQKPRAA
ncbi:MAG: hypothetical protein H8E44_24490 [Planctomycetes bacterium]|nr:hypothetical protein [Planctomycetota bacterium]MBL7043414.1 hypothetical protein [Pirellulaceae bacterium]